MMRKVVAALMVMTLLFVQVHPVLAQASPSASPVPAAADSSAVSTPPTSGTGLDLTRCVEQGRSDGSQASTGGAFTIGLVSGLLGGLLGMGIAYASQGEPDPPAETRYASDHPTCRMAHADAFGDVGKKKKRTAALIGGLLGTAVSVAIYLNGEGN